MRITRLQLRDFRRYRDLDITLDPRLTVIRGANEAGKTTIQRAVELVLTRKCTSVSADLDGMRPWDAPDDTRPEIAVEFEQEELEATRSGRIEKAFRGQKGTVTVRVNGETTTDPGRADEVIAELTGIPTEAFFRSTASIRHHEVADLARDESALRDRLQASISGADRGTSRAKKTLERALFELNTRGPKNPGRLKAAEEAVGTAKSALETGELALEALAADRDALVDARERRAVAERLLAEQRSVLEKARQAERLIAERDAAQERFERFRAAVAVQAELRALHQAHPSATPLPALRQLVERLRGVDIRMRELRAMLAGEIDIEYEVTTPEPTWRPLALGALILIVGGAAFAIGGQIGLIAVPNATLLGILAVVLGAGLAVLTIRQRNAALDFRRQKELRDVEIDRRLRGRSMLEEELRRAQAETAAQLVSIDLPDVAAAEDLLRREEQHVGAIERLTAQLDGLVGRAPADRLPELRDAAALDIDQKRAALEHLGPIGRDARARERLEVEVREAEAALEQARDDEAAARARVDANEVDAEEVAAHAERLAVCREQLTALQRRARVLETTLREIERAEQATMKTATRYLERHMAGDVARVTAGRYRRVQVDDRTLDISVWAPERGDWVPVSSLSQGTVDLVYLAARIGLVRLVTGDRRPPLVFDDPFVTFDDDRAARSFEVLRDLTTDFQVIYLTPSDRYDGQADVVVELPAPVAVDRGALAESAPAGA